MVLLCTGLISLSISSSHSSSVDLTTRLYYLLPTVFRVLVCSLFFCKEARGEGESEGGWRQVEAESSESHLLS
jgi:hypothetical protein